MKTVPRDPSPNNVVKKFGIFVALKYASVIPVAPNTLPIIISRTSPKIRLSIFIIITIKLDLNINLINFLS
jgi:hypothetical protein